MSRPPLPVGTYGKIKTRPLAAGGFAARAKYRDYDGLTRPVERVGETPTAAENRLREALRDRGRISADGDIMPDTKLGVVAQMWLRDVEESGLAIRTKLTYQDVWVKLLSRPVGQLAVQEVKVSTVDRLIRSIRERNGPGRAKHAKVVLAGILGLAVRHDALDDNPVRELAPARRKRSKERKIVLTDGTFAMLRGHVHASPVARRHDLVDVVDVLSGVGCRIGELLALDWLKLDFEFGKLALEGTVIRVPGTGLVVQRHTKSEAGMRTIYPPGWVMDILKRRYADRRCKWVFPSVARSTLRDPDNTRARLRDVVAGTEWVGLHPHAFRHLVATRLDRAGLTAREIADYLGHDKISMTQDEYMDRHVAGERVPAVLTEIAPKVPPAKG